MTGLGLRRFEYARVVRVVDGDTIMLRVVLRQETDLGWDSEGVIEYRRLVSVRIANISCPERGTPEGRAAKAYAEARLPVGDVCTLDVLKWGDKFGRTLGLVTLREGGDFGEAMIAAGHARPGDGRRGLVAEVWEDDTPVGLDP